MSRARRRVERVVHGPVALAGVFVVHDPRLLAGVLAAGMGAGAVGAASSSAGMVISGVINWGEREAGRYVRLPHKVLLVLQPDAAYLFQWPAEQAVHPLLTLRPGDFTATMSQHRWYRQVEVRIVLPHHKAILLSAKSGIIHRSATRCAQSLARLADQPPPTTVTGTP